MIWRLPLGAERSHPPMTKEQQASFPLLRDRFEVLDEIVLEPFRKHDSVAIADQRRHRQFQLALAVCVGLTVTFGALQAADEGRWVGVVLTLLGLGAAAIANRQRQRGALSRYLRERAKAEELRALYFSYLSGTGPASRTELEAAVARISQPITEVRR